MSLSNLLKFTSWLATVSVGTLAVSFLISSEPVAAFSVTFSNKGFEDSVNLNNASGWEGSGDIFIDNNSATFTQVAPVQGNSQAVITTGRHLTIDDPNTAASTFNYSDIEPLTATSDDGADALQDFLGLPTNSLSILRSGSADDTMYRTAKEGSGIYQDFTVEFTQEDLNDGNNIFEVDFNWSYLSNDGIVDSRLGEQDFGFFTIYDTSSDIGDRSITVLDSSDRNNVNVPHSGSDFQDVNTTQYQSNSIYTYTSAPIATPGTYTYRVGFGTVDVDGTDRTSTLLVDNFDVRQVPFDFSPSAGIIGIMGCLSLHHLKQKFFSSK